MEREPHDDREDEHPPLLGECGGLGSERPPSVAVEFGHLNLMPPEGTSWSEWVIARSTMEADREQHVIDHRTAYYIARFLGTSSTPALRKLAKTGEIDFEGMQQEIASLYAERTTQVQAWMAWLADYCVTHSERGPVESWRRDISEQDRSDAEWLRREQIFEQVDDLFQAVPPVQRVGNGGEPGWHGMVRHDGRSGGWIVFEGGPGERRVWETDVDAELEQRYVAIVKAQRQWVLDTFGRTMETSEFEAFQERTDAPDD